MALYRKIFGADDALLATSTGMTGGSIDGTATPGLGLDLRTLEAPATLEQASGMISLVNPPAVPSPVAEQPPAGLAIPAASNVGGGGAGTGFPSGWLLLAGAAALIWWAYFRKAEPTG